MEIEGNVITWHSIWTNYSICFDLYTKDLLNHALFVGLVDDYHTTYYSNLLKQFKAVYTLYYSTAGSQNEHVN